MEKLIGSLGFGQPWWSKSRRDDDTVDRLSHRTTVALLVLFSMIVSTKQFVGEPINCWTPAHFDKDSHDDYTNNYCWIRNTYYLHHDDYIPTEDQMKYKTAGQKSNYRSITYYQWVPMFLLAEALLFYLPYFIWSELSSRSGIDLHTIVEAGNAFTATEMNEIRDKTLMYMTMQLDRYLRCHKIGASKKRDDANRVTMTSSSQPTTSQTSCKICRRTGAKDRLHCGRRHGNYLILLFLGIKLLYLGNAIGQLFLLNAFLGDNALSAYGLDVLRGAVDMDADWPTPASARFPRVTMCNFKVRRLGNVHRYTVQCVLPINAFNEKIFLFVWFWFAFIAAMTVLSLIRWSYRFLAGRERQAYVKRHLQYLDKLKTDSERKKKLHKFVHHYLNQDGVFILRLVTHNTNTVAVTELVSSLWENFRKKPMVADEDDSEADV